MQKYPLHLIDSFLQYSQTLNMVQAAQHLGISQPALSRQLKEFESLIGQNLFKADGRKKALTPLGQELSKNLKANWKDYSDLVNETVDSFAEGPRMPVCIYGPSDMISRLALKLTCPFPLDFRPAESEEMEKLLDTNEISLGIGRVLNTHSQLVSKFMYQLDFHLIFPKSWQIEESGFGIRLLKRLADYPRISFRQDMINKNLITLLDRAQIQNHRVIPNWMAILEIVKEGKGWALAPIDVLDSNPEIRKQISVIKVPHEVVAPVKYYLMYRKDISKIGWMRKLIDETLAL